MPRYNKEHLGKIAQALKDNSYVGLANTIYWWNSTLLRERKRYPVMRKPLKDMPLFLNDPDETTKIIAAARLKISR